MLALLALVSLLLSVLTIHSAASSHIMGLALVATAPAEPAATHREPAAPLLIEPTVTAVGVAIAMTTSMEATAMHRGHDGMLDRAPNRACANVRGLGPEP
ncbi:hypothetical protein RCH23_000608 [Cryobacterium sp. CAN_C3]|uniref:hypothetical protein n=1 Tax=unclassified Cryobacterium TaxID=2649013 RepID=UPI0018C9E999|nr:hypothetical protein [Cryobacterium sp. CAN_C3]MEC5153242.1 hypothetical protein [Cryobacterium sp. CAN_C3]